MMIYDYEDKTITSIEKEVETIEAGNDEMLDLLNNIFNL